MYLKLCKQVHQPGMPEKITFYARAQMHRSITCRDEAWQSGVSLQVMRFYLTPGLTNIDAVTGNPLRCWVPG
jgi:hypothetical protein